MWENSREKLTVGERLQKFESRVCDVGFISGKDYGTYMDDDLLDLVCSNYEVSYKIVPVIDNISIFVFLDSNDVVMNELDWIRKVEGINGLK